MGDTEAAYPESLYRGEQAVLIPSSDPRKGRLQTNLRNWRRYRYEVTVALPPPGQLAMSSNQNLERLCDNQSTQTKSSGSEEALGIPQASETGEDLAGDLGATYGDHTPNEGGGEVPRFDWASVDVIGSLELSRLFRGLEIDCEAFIPMLSLDTFEPEPAAKAYLSGSDILDLFNEINQAIPVRLRQLELVTHSAPKLATQDNQSPQHPWRDIGAVFFGYDPGPFSEVYVFPSSHDAPNRAKNFEKLSLWEDLQAQKIELEAKFAKLETQFRINHPAHIEMSETLAKIYYRLHEGRKAEIMYRKLVELHSQSCGPNSYETLDTMINLIKSLERQGRDLEARSLSLDVRSIISKLCNPWHPISIAATIQYARIVSNLDLFEEAEPLRREVLQIRLLGNTLAKRGTKEGETLLRTAVQIISEDPAIKDTVKCQGMERLADAIFYGKEAYEESYNITANAVEQFTVAFGPSHPAILNLQHRLA
ncbi:uncharacterized protein PAC_14605 [Phialocephala subalpina]|uniref:MalT-like TPR region domain-containing protein n=1 Tax=Phialocephala subalpina TaxID=576137 RepID=A0A1L7XIC7_9HELO|nr:uncharacterized protein PAC_14605 [Phialocephala subalpina]